MPFPPPGELPDPGIESVSPELAGGFFITEVPGKPRGDGQEILLGYYRDEGSNSKEKDRESQAFQAEDLVNNLYGEGHGEWKN